jgi:indolepyruvate ferredoxin oxidoreductase, beta subunit
MKQPKIIIAGVGGQGVIHLTELLCEAAVLADIPVATSEIHGLSQRGSSVIAGITFGENTFGMVEQGGADFLLGLELLEAQRCLNYLHTGSIAVIDDTKIFPHAVNAEEAIYPDTKLFLDFLRKNIRQVIFIEEDLKRIAPIMRNIVVLAKAAALKHFPIQPKFLEQAILTSSKDKFVEQTLEIFQSAIADKSNIH